MPDQQQFNDSGNSDMSRGVTLTPAMEQQMLARAQQYVDAGDPTTAMKALPMGYTIDDESGEIREKTWWEEHGDLTTELGLFGASAVAPWLMGSMGAAGDTLESTMNAEQAARGAIPAAFGKTAVDTLSSAAPRGLVSTVGNVAKRALGVGGAPGGGGGASTFGKYGLPAISGVFNSLLGNRQKEQQLQLEESQLDPYRGQMHQASDVGKLDAMASGDFTPKPTTITGRYGRTVAAAPVWTPSDLVRATAAANEQSVAGGTQATLGNPLPATRLSPAQIQQLLRKRSGAPPSVNDPASSTPWLP